MLLKFMLSVYLVHPLPPPPPDNVYWLFSSSAQSISAFVAFLLTGYTFVHSVMEGIQQRDDTLAEVHHELRQRYYNQVWWLSLVTGSAITASLTVVYFNGTQMLWRGFFVIATSALNLAAIFLGLRFVLAIIDPDRYRTAASQLVADQTPEATPLDAHVAAATFFQAFVELESHVRSMFGSQNVPIASTPGPTLRSFRQMTETLYRDGRITTELHDELLEINRYRNLVFHGQVQQVDPQMVERVRTAQTQLV